MVDASVQNELLKADGTPSGGNAARVLDFARSLAKPSTKRHARPQASAFAGIMTPEEGKEFLRAIEEDCERIDPNEW